ncbi:MAG: TRAFs-binding domain-containing protein [Chryseolinea sp.]
MVPQEWLKFAPPPRPLGPGEVWNVFLSYRSINRTWVLNLYDVLIELGHKVFLDQYVLKPGDVLVTKLNDALEKSQAAVLIWSREAKDSEWVQEEYATLETKAKSNKSFFFVPVKIDSMQLPAFANNKIYIDFSSYPDGPNGGDLLRLLHGIVGQSLSPEAVRFANEQDEAAANNIAQIRAAIKNNQPKKIIALFSNGDLPFRSSPSLGCMAVEGLIKLKNNDDALLLLDKIIERFPKAIRPKQLKGLALARRGNDDDIDKAQEILGVLQQKNNLDPETMGIYARTWMDRYTKSNDINDLIQSRDLYAEAFDKSPDDYYTGINAAAKSIFIGTDYDIERGMMYASKVQALIGTEATPGDYWKTATVAEVFLIQKKYAEAAKMYATAIGYARTEKGSIDSSRLQATRLLEKLKPGDVDKDLVLKVFR